MVISALVIIFLFLKWWGKVPILRSMQYVTFKYGDFQKASRISLLSPPLTLLSACYRLQTWSPSTSLISLYKVSWAWKSESTCVCEEKRGVSKKFSRSLVCHMWGMIKGCIKLRLRWFSSPAPSPSIPFPFFPSLPFFPLLFSSLPLPLFPSPSPFLLPHLIFFPNSFILSLDSIPPWGEGNATLYAPVIIST